MKYPKITKNNFEEMTEKLIYKKSGVFKIKVSYPKTRKDFFDMTKRMFGVGLGVSGGLSNYRIDGIEDIYSELPIPVLWDNKYSQYDGLRVFLDFVFGELHCGGVASTHYGQYTIKGYRHRLRLQRFWHSEFVPSENIAKSS